MSKRWYLITVILSLMLAVSACNTSPSPSPTPTPTPTPTPLPTPNPSGETEEIMTVACWGLGTPAPILWEEEYPVDNAWHKMPAECNTTTVFSYPPSTVYTVEGTWIWVGVMTIDGSEENVAGELVCVGEDPIPIYYNKATENCGGNFAVSYSGVLLEGDGMIMIIHDHPNE